MPAMSHSEVLATHGVAVSQWDEKLEREFLGNMIWRPFMAMGMDGIVAVNEKLNGMAGDNVTFNISSEIIGGDVYGTQTGVGNEGQVELYAFNVSIDEVRTLVKRKGVKMSDQRVAFDMLGQMRPLLADKAAFKLDDAITAAMSSTASGRVQGRYRYGADESNWDATEATAKANIDDTNDKLTTKLISACKTKAMIPVNAHAKIRPWKVAAGEQNSFQNWYVLFAHNYAVGQMVENDAAWKNAYLNLPPTTNRQSPIFTGANFKGNWNGVLVYEHDRILLESSTIQIAHNLFCGAQAATLAWGMRPTYNSDLSQDLGHEQVFEVDEIRGVAKVVWNRASVDANKTNEDNAVIHLYTSGVNPY